MAVLLEFNDATRDPCRVESMPYRGAVAEVRSASGRPVWLTPALARRVAKALTEWADKEEAPAGGWRGIE